MYPTLLKIFGYREALTPEDNFTRQFIVLLSVLTIPISLFQIFYFEPLSLKAFSAAVLILQSSLAYFAYLWKRKIVRVVLYTMWGLVTFYIGWLRRDYGGVVDSSLYYIPVLTAIFWRLLGRWQGLSFATIVITNFIIDYFSLTDSQIIAFENTGVHLSEILLDVGVSTFLAAMLMLVLERALTYYSQHEAEQQAKIKNLEQWRMLGTVASRIGHEINNPMTILLGRLSLLPKNLEFNEKQKTDYERYEKILVRTVDRIINIAQNLQIIEVGSEYKETNPDISLKKVLEQVIDDFNLNAIEKNWIEVSGLDSYYVKMDEKNLAFVFRSLVENALLVVESEKSPEISIVAEEQSGKLLLRFSNNGPPINQEDVERIFEPFYQVKFDNDRLGLGLTFSKYFLNVARADLTCRIKNDRSVFTISFSEFSQKSLPRKLEKAV